MQILSKSSKSRKDKLLKTYPLKLKNSAVIFNHNVGYVFSHLRMDEYQKLTKTSESLKICRFYFKIAKIRGIKMLKTILLLL